jgi:hypothetical protein
MDVAAPTPVSLHPTKLYPVSSDSDDRCCAVNAPPMREVECRWHFCTRSFAYYSIVILF